MSLAFTFIAGDSLAGNTWAGQPLADGLLCHRDSDAIAPMRFPLRRGLRNLLVFVSMWMITVSAFAQSDRAALDAFLQQMKEHDAFCEATAQKLLKTPGGGVVLFRTVAARVKTIPTAGLPADLAEAFREYADCAQAVAAVFKDFPEQPPEIVAYMRRKIAENPNFQREEEQKNAPVMVALGKSIEKVDATGRKHGLPGLASLLQ